MTPWGLFSQQWQWSSRYRTVTYFITERRMRRVD